jgi:hypothetical protein
MNASMVSLEGQFIVMHLYKVLAEGSLGLFYDAAISAALCALFPASEGLHLFCDNLGYITLCAVLSVIGACLNGSFNRRLSALGKIPCAEVSSGTPCNNGDKICFTFALFIDEPARNRQPEGTLADS